MTTITTTIAAPAASPAPPALAFRKVLGNYKEQAAGASEYNAKLEEEGDANRPKANVPQGLSNGSALAD